MNKFTYKASEYMTDPAFRKKWLGARSENAIKIILDGVEIPSYSDYSYVDVKSYFKEPDRSAKGVINNLNSYATFLTPKIRFSFKSMPISAYRVIMKLIKERNEFIAQVYDPVEDIVVVRKVYFSPKDYPQLFTKGYEALRVNEEEFELIGTNADLNLLSLTYDSNVTSTEGGSTSNQTTGLTFYYGQEITIGDYDTEIGIDPTTFENAGFTFDSWNTERDGSGLTYLTGQSGIQFTVNTNLYAIWRSNTRYVVSFDYQGGAEYGSESTPNKEVIQGEAYGALPIQVYKDGYIFGGWFTLRNGEGTKITQDTIFDKTYNETLYAYWIGNSVTISFDPLEGAGTIAPIQTRTGESFVLPTNSNSEFYRDGYQNLYWTKKVATYDDKGQVSGYNYEKFADLGATAVAPAENLTLYPYWAQAFLVTYHTNDGYGSKMEIHTALVDIPVHITRIGYKLEGWYKNPELTDRVKFPLEIKENTDLYSKWEAYAE